MDVTVDRDDAFIGSRPGQALKEADRYRFFRSDDEGDHGQ
jgi:hypothetical protein